MRDEDDVEDEDVDDEDDDVDDEDEEDGDDEDEDAIGNWRPLLFLQQNATKIWAKAKASLW